MPSLIIIVVQGMNLATFKQPWSIIVRMVLKPFDLGRLVIRSMATTWKGPWWGLTGIVWSGACQCMVQGLFSWQVVQLRM